VAEAEPKESAGEDERQPGVDPPDPSPVGLVSVPAERDEAPPSAPRQAKRGRCAHHPGNAAVATCERCGSELCLTCAVPVRGTVFGPECLGLVLGEPPPAPRPAPRPVGDLLAAVGFGLVVVLSIFPWSRFGAASGPLEAWERHWSLLAVAAGAAGLVAVLMFRRRPRGDRIEGATYLTLAAVVAVAAYLHRLHPPPLSSASLAPLGAILGALVAATGAVMKLRPGASAQAR
jgi:hypothetical protein